MRSKSILIVEDDIDLLQNMADLLEMEGFKPLQARHGKEAFELLQNLDPSDQPDCIVLDLMMPIMDGKAFLEAIVENPSSELTKIPIIVATAKGSLGQEIESLPIKVDMVRKPIDIDHFLNLVAKHCHIA